MSFIGKKIGQVVAGAKNAAHWYRRNWALKRPRGPSALKKGPHPARPPLRNRKARGLPAEPEAPSEAPERQRGHL